MSSIPSFVKSESEVNPSATTVAVVPSSSTSVTKSGIGKSGVVQSMMTVAGDSLGRYFLGGSWSSSMSGTVSVTIPSFRSLPTLTRAKFSIG